MEEHYDLGVIKKLYYHNKPMTLGGFLIKNYKDDRYLNFIKHGFTCSECGIQGQYVKIDNNPQLGYHLNVYGIDKDGNEVVLTKDHIYPKSRGGLDSIVNYQVLCEKCNKAKADVSPVTLVEAMKRGYVNKHSIYWGVHHGKKNILNVKVKKKGE